MKRLMYLFFLLSVSAHAQSFKLTAKGYEPQVFTFDSLTAQQVYTKALDWVKSTYNKPNEVIRGDMPGEKLRIFGFMQNGYYTKNLGLKQYMDFDYWLVIEFKDGKMRVSFEVNQLWADGRKAMFSPAAFFKDDGSVRGPYKDAPPSLDESVNNLVQSLIGSFSAKKSDW